MLHNLVPMLGQSMGRGLSAKFHLRTPFWGTSMNARWLALLAVAALTATSIDQAPAQDAKKAAPSNPIGIGNWNNTVTTKEPGAAEEFDKKQLDLIQKVTVYFRD